MAKNVLVKLDYAGVGEAMRLPGVRAELAGRARRVAGAARMLAQGTGVDATIEVVESVRPASGKQRPEAQVRATKPTGFDGEARARLLSVLQAAGRST